MQTKEMAGREAIKLRKEAEVLKLKISRYAVRGRGRHCACYEGCMSEKPLTADYVPLVMQISEQPLIAYY